MRQRRLRKRRAAVVAVLSCEQSPRILVSSSVNNLIVIVTPRRQRATRTQHRHPESWVRPHITFDTEDRNLRTAYRYPHDETNFLCLSPFKLCIPPPYRHHHSTITRPLAGGFLLCSFAAARATSLFSTVIPGQQIPARGNIISGAHIFLCAQGSTTTSGPYHFLRPSLTISTGHLWKTYRDCFVCSKVAFQGLQSLQVSRA
jgi:hypothetical protein